MSVRPPSSRPLLATRADMRLFVDRDAELGRLRGAVDAGLNALVVGERGAGATSLLHRLEHDLRGEGRPVHYVNGLPAGGVDEAVRLLCRAAGVAAPADADALDLLTALGRGRRTGPRAVVLFDGLPDGRMAHALFGRLRDELFELPFTWAVAAVPAVATALAEPPADAFFSVTVELPPLADEAAAELLRRRAGSLAAPARAAVVELAAGRPRALVSLAQRALVEGLDGRALRARADAERGRREALGPSARQVLDELEAHGPASASDADLLARLGLTRAHTARLLAELEAAGLVAAEPVRDGPGRPRKVFRVAAGA